MSRCLALPLIFWQKSSRCAAFLPPSRAFFHHLSSPRLLTTVPNLVKTIETTIPINWDERISLQQTWSNVEKGWKVEVEWKMTLFGVGLFAAEDIAAGTVLRTGVIGRNLLQFTNADDIESFCQRGGSDEFDSRLRYTCDYLWGFTTKGTDEQGYRDTYKEKHRFYGCWVPGNGLNHKTEPNTVYRSSENGINLVALTEVEAGDELYDDYTRHGRAPEWLLAFSQKYNVNLNFAECNDFVDPGMKG